MEAFHLTNQTWTELGNGVKRQIVSYDENVMLVKVKFDSGAIGVLHQHPHVQMSYVESGVFEYTIDGAKQILRKGESCFVPSNKLHGCVCLETGILLDVFSPCRQDFL
ncbi:cupin [Sphingobacteriaceae bacterium]|nr:cupin [Sphingobacteriaceae bacterium]